MGITARASAPEVLIDEVINSFRETHLVDVEIVETAVENVNFKVPRVLREPAREKIPNSALILGLSGLIPFFGGPLPLSILS